MPFTPLGTVGTGKRDGGSVAAVTITLTQAAPSGTLLIVGASSAITSGLGVTYTVTDTGGNTWTLDAGPTLSGTSGQVSQYSTVLTTGLAIGAVITCTPDNSASRITLWADNFAGVAQSGYRDVSAVGTGTATAMTTAASASTAQPDELAYATFGLVGARTFTPGTGWTAGGTGVSTAGSAERKGVGEYQTLSAAGAVTATATQDATGAYAAVVATYKAAAVVPRPRIAAQAVARAGSW